MTNISTEKYSETVLRTTYSIQLSAYNLQVSRKYLVSALLSHFEAILQAATQNAITQEVQIGILMLTAFPQGTQFS